MAMQCQKKTCHERIRKIQCCKDENGRYIENTHSTDSTSSSLAHDVNARLTSSYKRSVSHRPLDPQQTFSLRSDVLVKLAK
jgi:hypothetical protein